MYIKINGKTKKYNEILVACTTQHGYPAIKFVGDPIPETDKGFKLYEDDGTLIQDLSEYVYEYKANIYSAQQDIIEEPSGNPDPVPESAFSRLSRQVSRLGSQVAAITPTVLKQEAYIGDTECVFAGAPDGLITSAVVSDGIGIPHEIIREDGGIRVIFEALENVAEVTISIS